jgi:hypothetical protein
VLTFAYCEQQLSKSDSIPAVYTYKLQDHTLNAVQLLVAVYVIKPNLQTATHCVRELLQSLEQQ